MKDKMISILSPDRQFCEKRQHFSQDFFLGRQSIIIYGAGQILIIPPQCVSSKCFPTGLSLSQPPLLIVPTIIIIVPTIIIIVVLFGNLYIITIIIRANVEMCARQMVQIGRKLIDTKIDLNSTNGQKGQEICHHFLIFVLISSSQESASENYFDISLRTVVDSWKVFIYDIKTAKCANHQQHILVNIWYQYIDLFVC